MLFSSTLTNRHWLAFLFSALSSLFDFTLFSWLSLSRRTKIRVTTYSPIPWPGIYPLIEHNDERFEDSSLDQLRQNPTCATLTGGRNVQVDLFRQVSGSLNVFQFYFLILFWLKYNNFFILLFSTCRN